jgi:hypothetical protein
MEVRRAILDLNEDRLFDEKDVEKFLTEFDAANGVKDYSRYDLNGDGLTGGTGTRAFNLDMDYPPTYTSVSQTIEDNSVSFNENSLTDLEILCYYAYSRLYAGSKSERKELLGEKCVKHGLKLMVGTPLLNNEPVQYGTPGWFASAYSTSRTCGFPNWTTDMEYNPCLNCDLPPFQYDGCTVTGGGFFTVDAGTSVTYDASAYLSGGALTSINVTNNNDGTELVFSLLGSTLADPTFFICGPTLRVWGSESSWRILAAHTVIDITNAKDHPVNLHISWDYTQDGTPYDPDYGYSYAAQQEHYGYYGESYTCPSDPNFSPLNRLFSVWCTLTDCTGLSGSRTLRIDPGHVQHTFRLDSVATSSSSDTCQDCSPVPIVTSTSYSATVTFRLEDPGP